MAHWVDLLSDIGYKHSVVTEAIIRKAAGMMHELDRASVFNTYSTKGNFTKFSVVLVGCTADSLGLPSLTVNGSFRGKIPLRGYGIHDIDEYADTKTEALGHRFIHKECLVDFMVRCSNDLDIVLTAESEALSIGLSMDTYDLDKLLMVGSPNRLYIGRFTDPKSVSARKFVALSASLDSRVKLAYDHGLVKATDTMSFVLVATSRKAHEVVFYASTKGVDALEFTRITLE